MKMAGGLQAAGGVICLQHMDEARQAGREPEWLDVEERCVGTSSPLTTVLLVTHIGSRETVELLCAAEDKPQLLSRPRRSTAFAENSRR
jgi:hypothetical protein